MERSTRQRDAIKAVIDLAQRPLSPQEILEGAQSEVAGLGMATVYRNLKSLVELEKLVVVSLPGESARYESAGHHHHHHFHCTACDKVFDVHQCPGNMLNLAPSGFVVERHELTLYGECDVCSKLHETQTAPT
jgi:Fur family ferric uptake transcriptional regulator